MKHKVRELEGATLDWAVALAEDFNLDGPFYRTAVQMGSIKSFMPSEDWGWAGPIIERESIQLVPLTRGRGWEASPLEMSPTVGAIWGESPLQAAMRARVWSKFGEEVDL